MSFMMQSSRWFSALFGSIEGSDLSGGFWDEFEICPIAWDRVSKVPAGWCFTIAAGRFLSACRESYNFI